MLAATVALAVVGMHHLTSSGCSEPVAHHGLVSMADAGPLAESPQKEWASESVLDDVTPGLVCLALLIAVGVVSRIMGGVAVRRRDLLEPNHPASVNPRIDDPPDLHILSISRT